MSPSQVRRRAAAGAFALALGLLAACGNSDGGGSVASGSSTGGAGQTLPMQTSEQDPSAGSSAETQALSVTEGDFTIEPDNTDLPAGDYEIAVTNNGNATHDLVVEKDGSDVVRSDSIGPGDSTTLTVTLGAGDYVFYCSLGNHRQMGMETDVTVS